MCYWDEDGEGDAAARDSAGNWEPAAINRARRRLTATLDRLAARSPADVWIAGQRVRYLVEGGFDSAALAASRECRAARWWCGALTGYALHASGNFAAAEASFDTALAAMPDRVRCRWTDISLLLDGDERDRYERLPCEKRDSVERRYWELAQPSYVVRGNDRRSEHLSRVLLAELSASAANAYGISWADDMREIIIRYGAPRWYAATWPTGLGRSTDIVGHDRPHGYHFAATDRGDGPAWELRARDAREKYAAPYIDSIASLDAQFAMLRRGDSALLVVVYSGATLPATAVLGVTGDTGTVTVARDSLHTRVRRARTAWKGVVAGVEAYDSARRIDYRARSWIAPPVAAATAPQLSTLLLFTADSADQVNSLDDALAHAMAGSQLRGTRRLGLYWEMYPPTSGPSLDPAYSHVVSGDTAPGDTAAADSVASSPAAMHETQRDSARRDSTRRDSTRRERQVPAAQADIAISVVRTDGGVLRWLAQALRITPRDSRLAVQWHESHGGSGIIARSVVLDLSQLPSGNYRVTVSAGPDDLHRTVTARDVTLR